MDQTPTPTKFIKLASELFPSEPNEQQQSNTQTNEASTEATSKSQANSTHPNPFDKSFKQSTSSSQSPAANASGNEPVVQELDTVDETISHDENDHEFVEEIVDEEEIETSSEKFKVNLEFSCLRHFLIA